MKRTSFESPARSWVGITLRTITSISLGLLALASVACSRPGPAAPSNTPPVIIIDTIPEQATAARDESLTDVGQTRAEPGAAWTAIPDDLVDTWELSEVRSTDGRPSFAPRSHGGVTLFANGGMVWSDGCGRTGATVRVEEKELSVVPRARSATRACALPSEDVHYQDVTHYELDGRALYLHTDSKVYVLRRFAYSPMSVHSWSLYSMVDRRSGAVSNVDRFRREYSQLLLQVERDAVFRFTDLDGRTYTGALRVKGGSIRGMAYDAASEGRAAEAPEREDFLSDNTNKYQKTKVKYPTAYARRVHWADVESFEVVEGTVVVGSEDGGSKLRRTAILELQSDDTMYRFIPR